MVTMRVDRPYTNRKHEGNRGAGDIIEVHEMRARDLERQSPPLAVRVDGKPAVGNISAPSSGPATAPNETADQSESMIGRSLSRAESPPAAPISKHSFKQSKSSRE